jgi:hypothetical protein
VLILLQISTALVILANYAALILFKSVSKENAAIVLYCHIRSYTLELPSLLAILSLYLFGLGLVC